MDRGAWRATVHGWNLKESDRTERLSAVQQTQNQVSPTLEGSSCMLSCVRLFVILQTIAHQLLYPWDSPGKNTVVGCHFLLRGIFLTQGLNSCLAFPALQTDYLLLGHQRSLFKAAAAAAAKSLLPRLTLQPHRAAYKACKDANTGDPVCTQMWLLNFFFENIFLITFYFHFLNYNAYNFYLIH